MDFLDSFREIIENVLKQHVDTAWSGYSAMKPRTALRRNWNRQASRRAALFWAFMSQMSASIQVMRLRRLGLSEWKQSRTIYLLIEKIYEQTVAACFLI